jgi:hypothetical protein
MMKKYSWIAALVLALSLAFFACDNGGGGKKGGGQQGGEEETLEWKTVWIMSEDDDIQALTPGPLSFAAGANPFKPLVRAGGDTDVTIKAVTTPDGTIGIEYTTIADWGAGVDLLHKEFGFRVGDKITILGEFLTVGGGYAQLNFRIGNEQSHGLKVEAAGDIEWEVELDAAMVGEIMEPNQYKDNPGLRLDGRSGGQVVRIDEIRIEGNRPTNIKTLAAPVITETATGVSWAAVDGADGYEVYADDDVVATPGASATSVNLNAIDTLVVDQEYEITVVAKGVAGTSKDSVPSNAITYTHKLPSLPDIYQVPAAGADYFFINLNDFATSGAVNPNVPEGELEADKITLSFTENDQRANFKFTDAQVALLTSAVSLKVTVTGTATPDTSFRYHIGDATTGSSWNATDPAVQGVFSAITGEKDVTFGANKSATTVTYFILQQRAAVETEVVIESIKIEYLIPSGFVAVTNITGVPNSGTVDEAITLTGTVVPSYATNKTIVWTINDADDGSASPNITNGVLTATAEGTVIVTATIVNGTAEGTNYTQDFEIEIADIVLATSPYVVDLSTATLPAGYVYYDGTGDYGTTPGIINATAITDQYNSGYDISFTVTFTDLRAYTKFTVKGEYFDEDKDEIAGAADKAQVYFFSNPDNHYGSRTGTAGNLGHPSWSGNNNATGGLFSAIPAPANSSWNGKDVPAGIVVQKRDASDQGVAFIKITEISFHN